MRRLVTVASVLAMSFIGFGAAAQTQPDKAQPPDQKSLREPSVERIRDLNLTDAQEAAIAGIREEYAPRIEEAVANLESVVKDEVNQAKAVLTPEQRVKVMAMKDEFKIWRFESAAERLAHLRDLDLTDDEVARLGAIRSEYRPKIVKALQGLKGILTPEQAKLREDGLKAGKPRSQVIASLKLTDEQKAKVEAVGDEVRTLVREELDKMKEVLNPEQQKKVAAMKEERREQTRDRFVFAMANYQDLNLTPEQKTKLEAIRSEYRPRVEDAGNQLRALVREEVTAIIAVLKA